MTSLLKFLCRRALGSDSLLDEFGRIEAEYAITPKSVAAMTSLYLPRIIEDFPDFSYDEMKKRADNLLTSYLLSIHHFDPSLLADGDEELSQKLKNYLSIQKERSEKEHFDQIKIHRTELSNYTRRDGRCIITFQSSVQYYYYVTDNSGQIVKGSKDVLFQTKYDVDLIYIQDRDLVKSEFDQTLGVNCPNCGAPIKSLGAKFCEYCGSAIVELNIHAWSFNDVREV